MDLWLLRKLRGLKSNVTTMFLIRVFNERFYESSSKF
jgi:hypothetical protein